MIPRRAAALPAALLLLAAAARADVFVLKDGTLVEGEILRTFADERGEPDRWEVRTLRGRRTIAAADAREVRRRLPTDPPYPWVVFEQKLALADPEDAGDIATVGAWAREQGMEAEAVRAFRRALAVKPDHAPARTALGYLRVDDRWVLPPGRIPAPEERGEPVAGEAPSRLEETLGRAFARRRSDNFRVESTWLDQNGLGRTLDTLETVRDALLGYLGEQAPAGGRVDTFLLLGDRAEYLKAVDVLVAPPLEKSADREGNERLLRLFRAAHLAILPPATPGCVSWRTSEDELEDRAYLSHFAAHQVWDAGAPSGVRQPDWLREAVAYAVVNPMFPDDPTWCVAAGYGRGDRAPSTWRNTRAWTAAARELAASGRALSFRDLATLDLNSMTFDALIQSWSVLQVLRARDEAATRAFLRRVRRGEEQFATLKDTLRLDPAGVDALWRTEVLKRR